MDGSKDVVVCGLWIIIVVLWLVAKWISVTLERERVLLTDDGIKKLERIISVCVIIGLILIVIAFVNMSPAQLTHINNG